MRVLIASTIVPFVEGGGSFIVDWLEKAMKEYGYETEVLKIPFHSHYRLILQQMVALRLFDIQGRVDRLIAIRTPSYIIPHSNKVLWFIHHHRGAYDLWGTDLQDIPNTREGRKLRDSIVAADNAAFREATRIFANSKIVAQRLRKYNHVEAEVLYPPLLHHEEFHCESYGDYLFFPSRLASNKRQLLAIRAMRYTKSNVRLIIAGKPDSPKDLDRLISAIKKYQLDKKVELIGRWISRETKIKLFANSLACVFVPFFEDSYGYVSLESFYSKKAVITCSDSGGPLELIEDCVNGLISDPEPRALAEAFDKIYFDKQGAARMGQKGHDRVLSLGLDWNDIVRKLTS